MLDLKQFEVWFITGSQHLYGEETLRQVDEHSQIIARYLDLQMTAWVFQGFFAIFLIMIVVIFQEELRQFFERIAVWSLARKRVPALGSNTSDILVRTLADLAKEHVGALIVIRGNDPLERHITGGIPLDGKLSGPLVKSIFDPHSPGHDGAVLVEQDCITRFAAHSL